MYSSTNSEFESVDLREARSLDHRSIAVVGINFEPETTGIAPYTTALARGLASAGAQVQVITGIPHYPQWKVLDSTYRGRRKWEERSGPIRVIRRAHIVPARPNLAGRALMEATFLYGATVSAAFLRAEALIAVTPSLSGLAAVRLAARGRPLGAIVQDLTGNGAAESGTTGSRAGSLIAAAEYRLLRRVDRIGVIAPRFRSVLTDHGVQASRIVDLPNFSHIEPAACTADDARKRLGWPRGRFTLVHTGNMGRKQGLESVIDAARIAEREQIDLTFVLVGDGNQRDALRTYARGVSSVRFVEPLSQDDYPYALAAADVLLVNERAGVREMSLPSKLTSYAIAGRPILAAVDSSGTTHELLSARDSALLIPPGRADDLLDAAKRLLSSPTERERLSERARQLYRENYSRDAAIRRYQRFGAEVLRCRVRQ